MWEVLSLNQIHHRSNMSILPTPSKTTAYLRSGKRFSHSNHIKRVTVYEGELTYEYALQGTLSISPEKE